MRPRLVLLSHFATVKSDRWPPRRKEPIWFDVAAWDKLADTVSKDFKKGDPVYLARQVSLHSYTPSVGLDEVTIRQQAGPG